MEQVRKLEAILAGWYKQLPFHLPIGGRKWLSENVWWIVLIGVVGTVLGILGSIRAYIWAMQWHVDNVVYYGATPNSFLLWLGIAFSVAVIVLEVMSISPLKNRLKKGWDLLFIAMLVNLLGAAVSAILSFDVASLLSAAIGFAIGGYFLFEIHDIVTRGVTSKKSL